MFLVAKPIIKLLKKSSVLSFFLQNTLYAIVRFLFLTYQLDFECAPEAYEYWLSGRGVFYFWHQQILSGMFFFFKKNAQGTCIVSPSCDGKIAGFICRKLGFDVLYGSGFKSSISVTRQALSTLKSTGRLCLVGDGSRGPAFTLQPGLTYLALKSQQPLIQIECLATSTITFSKSWDKFQLPLPFSKIIIKIKPPVFVKA